MLSKMGRMKIAWLPALIFCATLASVAAGLDLGPIIKTAQCCSTCLRRYTINGTYMERNGSLNYNSYMVIKNVLHYLRCSFKILRKLLNFEEFLVQENARNSRF